MLWSGRPSNSQRPGTLRAVLWRWLPLLASLAVLAVYSGSVSNFLSGSGDGPRPMQLQAATISQPQYEPLSENRLQSLEKRLAELQDTGTTPVEALGAHVTGRWSRRTIMIE